MPRKSKKTLVQKILIVVSGLAFLSFSTSMLLRIVFNSPSSSTTTANTEQDLSVTRLQQEAKGYEIVLEKEPNNRFALEKLVSIKLQLGQLQQARPLMERLVSIQPENERYQEVLAIINQGIEQQNNLLNSADNSPAENSPESDSNANDIEPQQSP